MADPTTSGWYAALADAKHAARKADNAWLVEKLGEIHQHLIATEAPCAGSCCDCGRGCASGVGVCQPQQEPSWEQAWGHACPQSTAAVTMLPLGKACTNCGATAGVRVPHQQTFEPSKDPAKQAHEVGNKERT